MKESTMAERRTLRAKDPEQVWQLEVVLADSEPPIWRRLRVLGSTPLHSLHLILQHAFGWTNSHLYQFEIADRRFAEPDPEDVYSENPTQDARRFRLQDLGFEQGSEFAYIYDFGDWWEHRIHVETVSQVETTEKYPCCVDGARAGPLDDSGGVHGYYELLAALADPRHPDHPQWSEWVPSGFDPEAFSAEDTTRTLQRFHGKTRRRARRTTAKWS
jgi:hypothetical protein